MAEYSPMMLQYFAIKEYYKDCLLFYRLGDFYEMFFDDAKTASKELDLTLTGRDCGQEERAPMCGVPYHSAEQYIVKLVQKGYKVAICEQTEDPATAKGIVSREVVRVVTAGTLMSDNLLESKMNNYLCSIYLSNNGCAVTFVDVSTGEMTATEINENDAETFLINEIYRMMPSEILINTTEKSKALSADVYERIGVKMELMEEDFYSLDNFEIRINNQFESNPVKLDTQLIMAVGSALVYLDKTQMTALPHIREIKLYSDNQFMQIDFSTRKNLELTASMREGKKRGSLLWVLDKTQTPMGGRMLRSWIDKPLLSYGQICRRQNAVAAFAKSAVLRGEVKDSLMPIQDIERLMSKIVTGSANPKDLAALLASLCNIAELKRGISSIESPMIKDLYSRLDTLDDVCALIKKGIVDNPPFSVREGNIIREGFDDEVDKNRNAIEKGAEWIAQIEAEERHLTGIKNLKISFNKVFGYFIEVSKSNIENVPEHYVRKQTLTNCERYITGRLKEIENTILGASERNCQLEYSIFCKLRECIAAENARILSTAHIVADIDALLSLAEVAVENNYVMPQVNMGDKIIIHDGRHPVIEKMQSTNLFVPNDTELSNNNRLAIITGPNMAGKSTYMRQVALITLMAQIGSFVPAAAAEIGVVDRIFTRVGASDDLASGQSTFMVEMMEVANILDNATDRSLLILDEIGRGTSTYDGLSIAWAVAEYVADAKKLGAKTLFATHYHELTELEEKLSGIKNYRIAVKKRGDDIIFLRKIVLGGADESYGIEVAKLAGVNKHVIKRAKEILAELNEHQPHEYKTTAKNMQAEELPLFENNYSDIIEKIKETDITTITPIEAMNVLYEIKKEFEKL